jgi:hypothetical protein
VGPRAGLDTEARGKIIYLCRGKNLGRQVVQSVARHYTELTQLPTENILAIKMQEFISQQGFWKYLITTFRTYVQFFHPKLAISTWIKTAGM